jgi:CheY-like chemotaxis protein
MAPNDKPSILLVEDNPADVQLFGFALEDAGLDCELMVIRDGGDALQLVRRATSPIADVAVIDLNLPKNDGIEILEAIRSNPALTGMPVLILSSSPSPRDISRVSAFPNTQYLTKPSFLDQYARLGSTIGMMLGRQRSGPASAGQ